MHISIDLNLIDEGELHHLYQFLKLKFDKIEKEEILNMDLSDIRVLREVDTRVVHLLKSRRIIKMKDLAGSDAEVLKRINGMGPRGLGQIKRVLRKYGLA